MAETNRRSVSFGVLGPLEAVVGGSVVTISGVRRRALLARLLIDANQVVSTERLIEDLWGEAAPENPANALQAYVSHVRAVLEPERDARSPASVLLTRRPGYLLVVSTEDLDATHFAHLGAKGRVALAEGRAAEAEIVLGEALRLWRGSALAEFADEAWARPQAVRLEELRWAVLEDRIEADLALGRHATVAGEAEAAVAERPLRERLWAHRMVALYRSGRQAEALRAYAEMRRVLGDELGIEPSQELVRLEEAILLQRPELDWRPTHQATHRPTRSPLSSDSQGVSSRPMPDLARHQRVTNLPTQLTSFVGRQRELKEVRRLLAETRLLTLTGPGGTGKTRLAIEAASDVAPDFDDGVFYVVLSAVRDPALVPTTIADAVGLGLTTERPVLDIVKDYLEHRRALLVIDNFEHLLAAAHVIGQLLQGAPHLRILVTSRARLRLSGEQELPVPPMELPQRGVIPGAKDLPRYDALALFVQRARAADPTFTVDGNSATVTEICARLDGLPLAIELAAARLNVLTPQLLRQRLEHRLPMLTTGPTDASARQRTLRGTIDWSYDLLAPPDQALFRRFSVFSGGCTVGTAEAVIGGEALDVLEGLSCLVEKSLLYRTTELVDEPRFRMLETIREYARDRLVESGEADDIERRHARYFLEVAETAEPHLTAAGTSIPAARLQTEQDNLRAAIGYAIKREDAQTGLRISSAIWRFWQWRGQIEEGRQWMARLLALSDAATLSPWLAKALDAAGALAYWQGDYEEASVRYEEALSIWRELGNQRGIADALRSLGYLAGIRGQYWQAHALHEQSRTISRVRGDDCAVAHGLVGDGMIYQVEGDAEKAQSYFKEACDLFDHAGERYGLATALCLLSRILVERGQSDAAAHNWRQAFHMLGELKDWSGIIIALSDLCAIELAKGRAETAVRLAGAAAGLSETLKVRPPEALTRPPDPRPAARCLIGSEAVESAWEAGRNMTLDQAIAYATELTGLDDTVRGFKAL